MASKTSLAAAAVIAASWPLPVLAQPAEPVEVDAFDADTLSLYQVAGLRDCTSNQWQGTEAGTQVVTALRRADQTLSFIAFSAPSANANDLECSPVTILRYSGTSWARTQSISWENDCSLSLGYKLLAADLNQDGLDDLALSAPLYNAAGCSSGGGGALFAIDGASLGDVPCTLPGLVSEGGCAALEIYGAAGKSYGRTGLAARTNALGQTQLAASSKDAVYLFTLDEDFVTSTTPSTALSRENGGATIESLLGLEFVLATLGDELFIGRSDGKVDQCDAADIIAGSLTETLALCSDISLGGPSTPVTALTSFGPNRLLAGAPTSAASTSDVYELSPGTSPIGLRGLDPDLNEGGLGRSSVAIDVDGDGLLERALATDASVMLVSGSTSTSIRARIRYASDDAARLGISLAAVPGVCPKSGKANALPGLLIGAPDAPASGLPPVVLVCPSKDWYGDLDEVPLAVDCNDADPAIYPSFQGQPAATEICDGKDNDCDGNIDEDGLTSYYPDRDGDGYGAGTAVEACAQSAGYVSNPDDCDDAAAAVNPDATELCDDKDNNCDGAIDEGFDDDGDDFGDCDESSCSAPCDCDDQDAGRYPGAAERCNGRYDDCNRIPPDDVEDDDVPPGEVDADGDGFRQCLEGQDCDDPSTGNTNNPNEPERCDGKDNNCNRLVDEAMSDQDGDGYSDCSEVEHYEYSPDTNPGSALGCERDPSRNPGKSEVCDGIDNDCNRRIDEGFDQDGDGVVPCLNDCNDSDPLVHAGAEERCDGVDGDCDGIQDLQERDSSGDLRFDRDHDGTLDCVDDDEDGCHECIQCPADASEGCIDSDFYGDTHCDCDEYRDNVYPGAIEGTYDMNGRLLPDGHDNDCDGIVDEGTTHFDDDGDDYCEDGPCIAAPGQSTPRTGDCDDLSPATYPGAPEGPETVSDSETADGDEAPEDDPAPLLDGDGVDNDCDGAIDEGTLASDDDDDGFCERDCTEKGVLPGDCDDADPESHPFQEEGVTVGTDANGRDEDCDGLVDEGTDQFDDDGDGFSERGNPGGDCDDTDAAVYPGAPELEDGIDNDCDLRIDPGSPHFDNDSDGFCEEAPCTYDRTHSRAPLPGDCDDAHAGIHPNAPEIACDDTDQDCDGEDGVQPEGNGAPEECNTLDDDCDGLIDEGIGWCWAGCSTAPGGGSRGATSTLLLLGAVVSLLRRKARAWHPASGRAWLFAGALCCLFPRQGWSATCTATVDEHAFVALISGVQAAMEKVEYAQARARALEALRRLPCVVSPVETRTVAALPYTIGLASWYQSKDDEEARRWFREALTIDPSFTWDEKQHPKLRELFQREAETVRLNSRVLLVPGWRSRRTVLIDGRPFSGARPFPPGPHLVQLQADDRSVCGHWVQIPASSARDRKLALRLIRGEGPLAQCDELPQVSQRLPWPPHRFGVVATGLGVAASVASAIALQADYTSLRSSAEALPTCGEREQLAQERADYRRSFARTWLLISGTAVASGVTLWLYRSNDDAVAIEGNIRPDGGAARLSIRF